MHVRCGLLASCSIRKLHLNTERFGPWTFLSCSESTSTNDEYKWWGHLLPEEKSRWDLWSTIEELWDQPSKDSLYSQWLPKKCDYTGHEKKQTMRGESGTGRTTWEAKDPYLPYIKNTSEEIERECRRFGVKVVFKSYGTLRQALVKVKTPREDLEKKDVVYEVPCMDCDKSYIGETGRNLKKWIVEHKYAIKRKDDKNGIVVHANNHSHRVDWEGARSLKRNPDTGGEELCRQYTYTEGSKQATWTVV